MFVMYALENKVCMKPSSYGAAWAVIVERVQRSCCV